MMDGMFKARLKQAASDLQGVFLFLYGGKLLKSETLFFLRIAKAKPSEK